MSRNARARALVSGICNKYHGCFDLVFVSVYRTSYEFVRYVMSAVGYWDI